MLQIIAIFIKVLRLGLAFGGGLIAVLLDCTVIRQNNELRAV